MISFGESLILKSRYKIFKYTDFKISSDVDAVAQAEDMMYFLFIGDLDLNHQEWLGLIMVAVTMFRKSSWAYRDRLFLVSFFRSPSCQLYFSAVWCYATYSHHMLLPWQASHHAETDFKLVALLSVTSLAVDLQLFSVGPIRSGATQCTLLMMSCLDTIRQVFVQWWFEYLSIRLLASKRAIIAGPLYLFHIHIGKTHWSQQLCAIYNNNNNFIETRLQRYNWQIIKYIWLG